MDSDRQIRDSIVRLLARREHASAEVRQRLEARGFEGDRIEHYIASFQQAGLLSDARYAENFARARSQRGYGPRYIRQALMAKEIAAADISKALAGVGDWGELAVSARIKRFGEALPAGFEERARQMRFLQQRGFEHDDIRCAMANED